MKLLRRHWLLAAAAAALAVPARAELSAAERARIERLIVFVANQKDMQFVRNGNVYSCTDAAAFLRKKLDSMGQQVSTAQQFIEQIASKSSMSGEPYMVRFADGRTAMAAHLLQAELKRIER